MTIRDFLQRKAQAGEVVIFRESGMQVWITQIDNEGLYIHHLQPDLLDLYEVICYTYERRPWANGDVLVLDIKRSEGDV